MRMRMRMRSMTMMKVDYRNSRRNGVITSGEGESIDCIELSNWLEI